MNNTTFNPNTRLYLEEAPANRVSASVLSKIRLLERQAKIIKKDGGSPKQELQEQVSQLIDDISIGSINYENDLAAEIDEIKDRFIETRKRRPMDRLADLEAAKIDVGMLSDEEIKAKAYAYTMDPGYEDELTAKLITGRLNTIDPTAAVNYKEAATQSHAFEPWLHDPDAMKIAQELEMVRHTKPGNVAFLADGALMQTDIESLIDYHGELDR